MFWPDYLLVFLFLVIVALVVFLTRQQTRRWMNRAGQGEDTALKELIAELKRTNDQLERIAGDHERRIAVLESSGEDGDGKP